jgi:hypothetical protein
MPTGLSTISQETNSTIGLLAIPITKLPLLSLQLHAKSHGNVHYGINATISIR